MKSSLIYYGRLQNDVPSSILLHHNSINSGEVLTKSRRHLLPEVDASGFSFSQA